MEFRQRHQLTRPGLSLIEVLMVVSVVGLLAAYGLHGFASTRNRSEVSKETTTLVSILREAQSRSMAARDGRAWAVRCLGATTELFSYDTMDYPSTTTHAFLNGITCRAGDETRFQKLTGEAVTASTWRLSLQGQAVNQVTVSPTGSVKVTSL